MKTPAVKPAQPPAREGRGGRPPAAEAARLEARILDTARELFFRDGYGVTSIETLAREARISKRTFYHRFKDKPDLFRAVVRRVINDIRPPDAEGIFKGSFEQILEKLAEAMLRGALSPQLIALNRLLLAEAPRFPELVEMFYQEGARQETIDRIASLLKREAKTKGRTLEDPAFEAEQFIILAMGAPQRRAMMGLGKPMKDREIKDWAQRSVALFLNGLWGK